MPPLGAHLLLEVIILGGHGRQLLAYPLVNLQILGHAPVQADGFALACKYIAKQISWLDLGVGWPQSDLPSSASEYFGGMHFLWQAVVIRLYRSDIISTSISCISCSLAWVAASSCWALILLICFFGFKLIRLSSPR